MCDVPPSERPHASNSYRRGVSDPAARPLAALSPVQVGIATPLREATDAGRGAAADGGNAIDAALAAAAMLTVAYPHNCALGGDLLASVRDRDGNVTIVNASGRAPLATDADEVRRKFSVMPLVGPTTVTVPGLASGWAALHAKGAQLTWARLIEPAAAAAHEGVAVSSGLSGAIAEGWDELCINPGLRRVLAPKGEPLREGQTLRQPALARTLRSLAAEGVGCLYQGEVGRELVSGLRDLGVELTMTDLAGHTHTDEQSLHTTVDGWRVDVARPNSQGFVLLRLLGMLGLAGPSAGRPLHTRVPAGVLGRALVATSSERDRFLADSAAMDRVIEGLLTEASLAGLLEASRHASSPISTSKAPRPDGDTVAVAAADTSGRSVSLIQSLYHSFGSQLLEPTTGIVVHNRGACFSLDPSSPNVLAPGKRPAHTLTPTLAERDGHRVAIGTMGGEFQPQILLQVLSRVFAGATPQQAVGAPRWTIGPWDRGESSDTLSWEPGLESTVVSQLSRWPGPSRRLEKGSARVGHAQAVRVVDGQIECGTDPRADP